MASLSKFRGYDFTLKNSGRVPCDVLHPGMTCMGNALDTALCALKGTGKLFFILYLIRILVKRPRNLEVLLEEAKELSRTWLFGFANGSLGPIAICLLRNILGRFFIETTGFIPGAIAGCSIFIEKASSRTIKTTFILAQVIGIVLQIFQETKSFTMAERILLFSVSTSSLFFCIRSLPDSYTLFWPFVPQKIPEDPEERKHCRHKGSCFSSIRKTATSYFQYALVLQGLKLLMYNFKAMLSKPFILVPAFLEWRNLRVLLFASLYFSSYKAVSCFLVRARGKDEIWHSLAAGAVASLCYMVHPNSLLLHLALSNLAQILCRKLKKTLKLPGWPWQELLYILMFGFMFHTRTSHRHVFPQSTANVMDIYTNGKCKVTYNLAEECLIDRSYKSHQV